jgi:hypothetical protein
MTGLGICPLESAARAEVSGAEGSGKLLVIPRPAGAKFSPVRIAVEGRALRFPVPLVKSKRRRLTMKKLILVSVLGVMSIPGVVRAQSAFDGTWKIDLTSATPSDKPDVFILQGGMYECKTCNPPFKVKADGADQAISGSPYIDTVAIKVLSDHAIEETDKKGGNVVSTSTATVSADGKTVTFSFTDSSNTNGGPPVEGKGMATLVSSGPTGSHAVSGSWRMSKMESLSDNGTVWSYKVSGKEIAMSTPTGQSYTANLDGTDAPMKGDPGVTSVSVRMIGSDTLEETDKRDGKVISVSRMTVSADGKRARISFEDKQQNRTSAINATKQ